MVGETEQTGELVGVERRKERKAVKVLMML